MAILDKVHECMKWVPRHVRNWLHYGLATLTVVMGGMEAFLDELRHLDWSPVSSPETSGKIMFFLGLGWLFLHHFLPAHHDVDKA